MIDPVTFGPGIPTLFTAKQVSCTDFKEGSVCANGFHLGQHG
jgi:hypothetical protein